MLKLLWSRWCGDSRRHEWRYAGVFGIVGLTVVLMACAREIPSDRSNFDCVSRLRVPAFPAVAQSARMQPELKAAIKIGPDGRLASYDVEGLLERYRSVFTPELDNSLQKSQFRSACAGKTVQLVFSFKLDRVFGEAGNLVWFEAPNRFTVTAIASRLETARRP